MSTIILISLFFCHFLCDYTPLSTRTMLAAKSIGSPLLPILNHAFRHSLSMFITLLLLCSNSNSFVTILVISLFQLLTHFLIDTLKGKTNVWYPEAANSNGRLFWAIAGFDQWLHAVVIILMVYLLKV